MNGIRERIDDALLLWKNGRHEGALLCALVAFAATAQKCYPKLGDREKFERLWTQTHPGSIAIEYRGQCQPIEHIFYKWLRCQLVHEGRLPLDLKFTRETEANVMSFRAGGAPEYILKIGHGWFHEIVRCVNNAPENKIVASKIKRGPTIRKRSSCSRTKQRKCGKR